MVYLRYNYTIMALNIKNAEVEHLADEIAHLTSTTKTEAIRQALLERRERLSALSPDVNREQLLRRFMENRIWPGIPASASRRWTKEEEEAALGYGESGEPV
jgi:antitoxin VapB